MSEKRNKALEDLNTTGEIETEKELTRAQKLRDLYRSSIRTGEQLLSLPPVKWLIPQWLPMQSLNAIYGPPGSGKSFYSLSLCLEIARGGVWLGHQLEPTPVLYVMAEKATLNRDRLEAWSTNRGLDIPPLFYSLVVGYGDSFGGPPQLKEPDKVDALCEIAQELATQHNSPVVVVLDTYAQVTLGIEENSTKETNEAVAQLHRILHATRGGIVIPVHHTGKDITKGLRGSTSLLGAVDTTIEITGGEGIVRATVKKSNAGAAPLPEWYKLESVSLDGEEERSSAVLMHTTQPVSNTELAADILELIRESLGGSATRAQLTQALLDEKSKEVAPATVGRYLTGLVKAGELLQVGKARASRYEIPNRDN
jgi:RecA/RadA recombinase